MENKAFITKTAFSLIEISIVILVVGIILIGISQGEELLRKMRLSNARSLTESSVVASTKGLLFWFETTRDKSFTMKLSDEAEVSEWRSINPQSPIIATLTGGSGAKPLFEEDGIADLPAVKFDADFMYHGPFALGANYTVFLVFKATTLSGISDVVSIYQDVSEALGALAFEIQADRTVRALHRSPLGSATENSHYSVSPNLAVVNTNYIASYVRDYDASSASVWLNNTAFISAQSASVAAFDNTRLELCLGRVSADNATQHFYGLMSELIIFDRALRQEEIDDVEEYLAKKYKISGF